MMGGLWIGGKGVKDVDIEAIVTWERKEKMIAYWPTKLHAYRFCFTDTALMSRVWCRTSSAAESHSWRSGSISAFHDIQP